MADKDETPVTYAVTYHGPHSRNFAGELWEPGETRVFDAAYLNSRGRTGSSQDEATMFQAFFTNNGSTPYITIEPAADTDVVSRPPHTPTVSVPAHATAPHPDADDTATPTTHHVTGTPKE
jgi:hypothetical protein